MGEPRENPPDWEAFKEDWQSFNRDGSARRSTRRSRSKVRGMFEEGWRAAWARYASMDASVAHESHPSTHSVTITADPDGFLHLGLECTAAPGAPCRRRPVDRTLEEWSPDDPNIEFEDDECFAVEWVNAEGFEDAVFSEDAGVFARIPVRVSYEEGVIVAPAEPHPVLDVEGGA